MNVQVIEAQLKKNMDVLLQIFAKHEIFLERFSSAIATYIDTASIAKPLSEAAGAEISSSGRASKRTIYGSGGMFGGKRGKGLAQYLAEKTWALGMLMQLVQVERAEASQQANFLYATLRETDVELKQEEMEGKKLPKRMQAKLKQVEKLTKQCEVILKNEAARAKNLMKITNIELANLRNAYSISMRQGALARKMTGMFFAPMFLKTLMLTFEKEQIFFSKFMKEEDWVVNTIAVDLRAIFKLIQAHETIAKMIGGSPAAFKGDKVKAKQQQKVSKRIQNLMKSLERTQKHLQKIKKGAAKYGIRVSRTVTMIDAEEKAILKEEQELEKELENIDRLLENMQRFSMMISRFINSISIAEVRLKPQINWINMALTSAYKISKKNPSGSLAFLEKVAQFAEKALVPSLNAVDVQRRELFKEFIGEEGVIKALEKDMGLMYTIENKGFLKNLERLSQNILQIDKSVEKGTNVAIKELGSDIRELKQALAEEKQTEVAEAQAGAPKTTSKAVEMNEKIVELSNKMREMRTKYVNMKREFAPAALDIHKAVQEAPHFQFASHGMFSIFTGGNVEDRMIKDISLAVNYIKKEEKEESLEIASLRKWFAEKTNVREYAAFVIVLNRSFLDESFMLSNLMLYYKQLALLEKFFSIDLRKAERTMMDLERGIRLLQQVMSKYTDLFGEEEKTMLSELMAIFAEANKMLGELKKTENVLLVMSHNLPGMEHAAAMAKGNILSFLKIVKDSIKNAKTASKFFGKEMQMKL